MAWFLARHAAARAGLGAMPCSAVQLGRHSYVVRGDEIAAYAEIVHDRTYDRLPAFSPRPGEVVIDVGADAGIYALRCADAGATVHAFEPAAGPLERLRSNVAGCAAVRVHPVAVADRPGTGSMRAMGSVMGSQLAPGDDVRVVTLDTAWDEAGRPEVAVLKVDVEGSEVRVIRGAAAMLDHVRGVVVEFDDEQNAAEVRDALRSRFEEVLTLERIAYYLRR